MDLTDGLPPSVAGIAEFLAMAAQGYDNHLKWNEQAMFKADLMNVGRRWAAVDPTVFARKCMAEGMRVEDVTELVDWLMRAQAGRRLVPQRSYRQHQFPPPTEAELALAGSETPPLDTSIDW